MSKYQARIIKEFEAKGFGVIKLSKTNKNGIADLLVAKPGATPMLIECKEKTDTIKQLQIVQNKLMADKMGFNFYVLQDGKGFIEYDDMLKKSNLF